MPNHTTLVRSRLSFVSVIALLTSAACSKTDGAAGSTTTTSGPLPADAVAVDLFNTTYPFNEASKHVGKAVKVHGYAKGSSGLIPVTVAADKTVPFVFCDVGSKKLGLKKDAHVVAEGTLDDKGSIGACKVTLVD